MGRIFVCVCELPSMSTLESPTPQSNVLIHKGMWQHSWPKQVNAKSMLQGEQIRQTKASANAGQG